MTKCPFCFSDKDGDAPVCPACNRETVLPEALLRERDELAARRDVLRNELAVKEKRLFERSVQT